MTGSVEGVAEEGRLMLDKLHIGDSGEKRMTKRQISEGTYVANTPGAGVLENKRVVLPVSATGAPLYESETQHVNLIGARKVGVVPKMWSAEEDELLRSAVKKHGEKNWRLISEAIPGRNHLQCLQRWKKALRPGLVKGQWSKEEDALLLSLIQAYTEKSNINNVNWAAISQQIDGRNAKQCRERWFLNLDPSINRGPWTPEEDRRLLELASQCGGRWSLIAKNMDGRTENSVKTRYHSLQRIEARNRGWTENEDQTLLNATLVFGRDWGKISKQMPGRSRGQLKKRFAILTQHRPDLVRQVEGLEEQIKHGKVVPPNPPPPPIQPIGTQFLSTHFQSHGSTALPPPSRPPMSMAPPVSESAPSYHSMEQPTYSQAPQPGLEWGAAAMSAPPPPPPPPAQESRPKGMQKFGSSWMNGIMDNLDPNIGGLNSYPSDMGGLGGSSRSLQRADNSTLGVLDKLLDGGSVQGLDSGLSPSLGGEVSAPQQAPMGAPEGAPSSKGLRQYSSWGSIGGGGAAPGDLNGLFADLPAQPAAPGAAPSVMRTGSSKSLRKMGSSNWGTPPTLNTYDSGFKDLLQML